MNTNLKKIYFRRALFAKHKTPPKRRLPRLLYPERVEARYRQALADILAFTKSRVDARVKPKLAGVVEHYGKARQDADGLAVKYYLAFIFDKAASDYVLHCTHKYLGALSPLGLRQVETLVDRYFLKDRKFPRVVFNQVEYFGEEKDLRVLTPSSWDESEFFPDLRAELEKLRKDDFPEYRPHVTAPAVPVIDRDFSHYALISKRGIHRTWPMTVRADVDDLDTLASELEQVRIEVSQEYTDEELKALAKLTGKDVAEFNARQMNSQLGGIAEIDLFGAGGEPWLARDMGAFVSQNVSLIKSIPDEYLNQVEKLVATSVRAGLRVEEIAADIDDRYDVSESRATLIARDQIGKFNGQLTESRQRDLGVEKYIWRGVGDARERDSHRVLNDTAQTWDDPPEVGHPGEDIQCRCWAEPDLSDFYGDEN